MTSSQPAADPHLSEEERAEVLRWLEESHRQFLAAVEGVPDDLWGWKPDPGSWSIGETAEHVVLAESLMFAIVCRAVASAPNPGWEEQTRGKTEFLFQVLPARQGRAVAPERIVPKEGLSCEEVKQRLNRRRAEIEAFARETQAALKEYTVVHPFPVFGTLNAHQWLLYIPLHTERHAKQIEEIRAAAQS